jgi:fimbrial chaperone protein
VYCWKSLIGKSSHAARCRSRCLLRGRLLRVIVARRRAICNTLGAIVALAAAQSCLAGASMQISPVLVDLEAPAAASTIEIANQAPQPASIQVRVFAWTQADGNETLTPSTSVVASPPFATIAPGATLSIRVIRSAQAPVKGEEAYRIVVDQLPENNSSSKSVVSLLLRQVLPAFFGAADKTPPDVSWSIRRTDRGYALFAHNSGDRRLRISGAVLILPNHHSIKLSGGLLGYVLGHADMSWTIPRAAPGLASGASVSIRADSDMGAVFAKALVPGR